LKDYRSDFKRNWDI